MLARLAQLAAEAPGCVSVERATIGQNRSWSPPSRLPAELIAARFDRQLDLRWRRTSYSDITAAAHEQLVASEPEESILSDEPEAPVPVPASTTAGLPAAAAPGCERPSPMSALPVGVQFGTFVHRVLEATEFDAEDLDAALARADRPRHGSGAGSSSVTRRRRSRDCARRSRRRSAQLVDDIRLRDVPPVRATRRARVRAAAGRRR